LLHLADGCYLLAELVEICERYHSPLRETADPDHPPDVASPSQRERGDATRGAAAVTAGRSADRAASAARFDQ
jgi:hypothetical protein